MPRITHFLLLLFLAVPAGAREDLLVCGSYPDRWKEELHLHRQSRLRPAIALESARQASIPSVARDIGNLTILEDRDGVVARRNDFNLDRRLLTFTPSNAAASAYKFSIGDLPADLPTAANAGTPLSGLGDDDAREVVLPFPFPFFGATYNRVFVNSDGNLTFNAADAATTERSLGRVTAGPPRIAGLFRDLDPSIVADSVRTIAEAGRFTVTWTNVPEYSASGFGITQTFHIRLYAAGRIEVVYERITTRTAVVGVAPGGVLGATEVVAFAQGDAREFTAAVVERFTNVEEIDIVLAAQKFYETHDDAYDYLAIFNNLAVAASPGAVAYEVTVRNQRTGYGDTIVESGAEFGSPRRLQAVLNFGPITQYPADPNAVVPSRATSRDTPLTILGHEAGHLFLAFASVRDPFDPSARPMLGRQTAHWNFVFNSEASLLEGNRIRDDGPGVTPRFTTVGTVEGYAPLDQYLMGFRAPEEVPPTFLVENPTTTGGSRTPQTGVRFDGRRRDIQIDEIVAAEGRRVPDHTVAQRRYRIAFILVTGTGVEPAAQQIQQIETYRQAFEPFFARVTDQRAAIDTALRRAVRLSTAPAAGVLAGSVITASVNIASPADTALTFFLRSTSGAVQTPPSATIAAGATRATFEVRGVRAGVDDLVAESADTRYDSGYSRVQVLASIGGVRLEVVSGDRQIATPGVVLPSPVVFRAVDSNRLPYAGLRVQAAVTAGGAVDAASVVTDEDGLARFRWTPASGPLNDLRATIEGTAIAALATATGRTTVTDGAVVNAASFAPGLAIGGIGTVFGLNLTGGSAPEFSASPRDRLANAQVLIDGRAMLIFYASDRQINFYVPPFTATGNPELVVANPLGNSAAVRVSVAATQPGIFFYPETGQGAVLLGGTGRLTFDAPAAAGDAIEVYTTGLGSTRVSPTTGLQVTVLEPGATIGGVPATVVFSGLAPGFTGLYQVNLRVPAGVPPGRAALRLTIDGKSSNEVAIGVR